MKLTERVMMIALINAKFRRGIFWFMLNFTLTVASLVVICYGPSVGVLGTSIAVLVCIAEALVFFFYYGNNQKIPWVIRRNELKSLNDSKHANFEELIKCVPLSDYFCFY